MWLHVLIDKYGLKWYKGNVHAHSTLSDGNKPYGDVVALYRDSGYDFLSITDHWVCSETVESPEFLLLSGREYEFVPQGGYHGRDRGGCYVDFNAVGFASPPDIQNGPGLTQRLAIDEIHRKGGIAILNHPEWARTLPEDIWAAEGWDGIEIYNTLVNDYCFIFKHSDYMVDEAALAGHLIPVFGTDDPHTYAGEECKTFIYAQAESLTRDGILQAIRERRFFASQGPWVRVREDGGALAIECTPACAIHVATSSCLAPVLRGDGMTEARVAIADDAFYYRVEVMDSAGRMAWTHPTRRLAPPA
jgi:hypothetical protein